MFNLLDRCRFKDRAKHFVTDSPWGACLRYFFSLCTFNLCTFCLFINNLISTVNQDFLGDDFKSQGSHVPYNVADFSTQVQYASHVALLRFCLMMMSHGALDNNM